MKSKKLILAIAIFGGVLFTVTATNILDLNEQSIAKVDKRKLKPPTWG